MTENRVSLACAMAELVQDISGHSEREDQAFRLGFRLGFHHGVEVGRGHAEREIEAAWAEAARKISCAAQGALSNVNGISEREADRRVRHAEDEWRRLAREHAADFTRRHLL